ARLRRERRAATGAVSYASVGVTTQDPTPALARHFGYSVEHGAVIARVQADSPAAKAGLRGGDRRETFLGTDFVGGGDVIVAIAGHPVRRSEELALMAPDAR